MKVPLLDLKAQYQTIKHELWQAMEEVLESQHFILGPKVEALEEAVAPYCGCQYGVGVSSGTDALLIALMVKQIGPGQGVITVPYTFFSTAGSVYRLGATPFFVDIDPVTYNIDPRSIKNFVEAECNFDYAAGALLHKGSGIKIRAIIPVHLYGQCAEMDSIMELAKEYHLVVIEDGAQAIGAEYPFENHGSSSRAGSMGDFGCFSFFPSKNLGGFGDGGMVTTSDREMAEKLKIMRAHGSKPKYYHHLVGGNFRLDALQAAVLSVKFKYLDTWTDKRRQNAAYYNSLFQQSGLIEKGFIFPPKAIWESGSAINPQSAIPARHREPARSGEAGGRNPKFVGHIYNQYVIRAKRRDELRTYLREHGVGTEIYYPLPLHQQECFVELGYKAGDFPESEKAAAETLALPIYPELEPAQMEYVVARVSSFYAN
ncbi:MAG: DegT/DnrJ/EryC1/StrS family aminotransferase [Deltaproteobacteria bacterium]|nr:DegT/DnrJ/EryC1/StrS family aminotransferase [Deltaproteobacteria bacterium]